MSQDHSPRVTPSAHPAIPAPLRSPLPSHVTLSWRALIFMMLLMSACASRPPQGRAGGGSLSGGRDVEREAVRDVEREVEVLEQVSLIKLSEEGAQDADSRGLTLHLQRRPQEPLSVAQLWVKAGSQSERPEGLGAASVTQQLILGDERDPQSLRARLHAVGARVSGWSSSDRAVFEVTALPERLEEALAELAQAVRRPRWSEEAFEQARLATLTQHLTARQWAGRRLLTRLLAQSFHGHPNGRLISPAPEQLKALTLSEVKAFYEARYRPSLTHLICVGDLDEGLLRGWVASGWGSWQATPGAREPAEPPPFPLSALRGPEVEVEVVEGGLAQLLVSLPIPHLTPEMVAYLDLTSLLLTGDGDGLLYGAARRLGVELREARAFPVTPDGPGALIISLEVSANDLDQLWGALVEQLNELRLRPPSLRQLEQVKLLLEREGAQTRASLTHQARRLGFFSTRWPNANALSRYRRALSQVRPRELTSFLRDVFVSERLHALVRSPAPKGLDDSLWAERLRERAVAVMNQRNLKLFPGFHALDDQLGLLFEPSPSEGVVSLSLTLPTRPSLSRASELSLGHWLAAQMSERQPYEPHVKARFHHEALELSTTIDARQLDDALAALLRRVRGEAVSGERAWSSETLERARVKAMGALELARHQPWRHISELGDRVALAFDYPPLPSASERLHALKELGSAQLVRWYQEHVARAPALLVVTGDVSRAELSRALRASLERGQGSAFTEASLKRAPLAEPLKRCRQAHESSDRPLTWLNLRFGLHDLTPRDLPALALLEAALTTPQGAPYRALKRVEGLQRTLLRRGEGAHSPHLSLLLSVRPEQTSALMSALQSGVRSLTDTTLSPEALAELKRAARAREAHALQHVSARAQWLSAAWLAGWRAEREGEGLLSAWWRAIDGVSAEELQRVSRAVLRFEQAAEAQWSPPNAPSALSGCSKVTL